MDIVSAWTFREKIVYLMKEYPILSLLLGVLAGGVVSAIGLYLAHSKLDETRHREDFPRALEFTG